MGTRSSRFWVFTFVLGIFVTVQSLRTWRGISAGPRAIPESKTVLNHVRQAQVNIQHNGPNSLQHTVSDNHGLDNATLGFQKIFAINLPSRTDKRDGMLLASRLTGFHIEFIDGVDPAEIPRKALPHKYPAQHVLPPGGIGCWRAHMNVLAKIVEDNLSTALVLEDDADWDIRLIRQLEEFAVMSNAIQSPSHNDAMQSRFENLVHMQPLIKSPAPYGSDWDVLLLGNCGVDIDISKPYVVRARDETVPDLNWLKIYGDPNGARLNPHPMRARLVGYALDQTCTYAYAVTQQAARRLLLDLGLERLDKPIDLMMREWCEGKYPEQGSPRRCIGVLPSLFESYRKEGPGDADSDIDGNRDSVVWREKATTPNIRKSVRMNLGKLLDGMTVNEIEDQFPNFRFGQVEKYPAKVET